MIAVTTTYLAFGRVLQLFDGLEVDLGDVLAVLLGQPGRDADVLGDFGNRLQRGLRAISSAVGIAMTGNLRPQ